MENPVKKDYNQRGPNGRLELYKTKSLTLARMSDSSPQVSDLSTYLFPKALGTRQLLLWDRDHK
jgi:hypothetical protein